MIVATTIMATTFGKELSTGPGKMPIRPTTSGQQTDPPYPGKHTAKLTELYPSLADRVRNQRFCKTVNMSNR